MSLALVMLETYESSVSVWSYSLSVSTLRKLFNNEII